MNDVDLLVMGLGNVICTDDGAGIRVVERIRAAFEIPDGAQVLDGGTLGLSLLPYLRSAGRIVLVDAIRSEELAPGTVVRLEGSDVARVVLERLSPHQIGVADLLSGLDLLDGAPDEVILIGVVAADIGLGVELTPAVEAALDELTARTLAEAEALGFVFAPKEGPSDEALGGSRGALHVLGVHGARP